MLDNTEIATFAKKVSFLFMMVIVFFATAVFCFYMVSPYHSCVRSLTSDKWTSSEAHLYCMRQK